MTKLYEAMENAGREKGNLASGGAAQLSLPSQGKTPQALEEKFLALYQRIDSLLDGEGGKVIQFVPTQPGNDGSCIARQFAQVLSRRLHKKILLLGANLRQETFLSLEAPPEQCWACLMQNKCSVADIVAPTANDTLSIGRIADNTLSLAEILSNPAAKEVADELRKQFDLVVIDAPPTGGSWDAVLLASISDGSVFVVEAGRTRWQVIRNAMEQFGDQERQILGVILNKQRRYIPGWIYRKFL